MTNPTYRLCAFGGLTLVGADGAAPAFSNQRKRLALLALLAWAGDRGVSRDRILAWFWPESDADRARNTLNQLVHGIRRELGDESVVGSNGDLRLNNAALGSDIADFRGAMRQGRLDAAATAYGGPFLDGVYLRDMPEFERWIESTRQEFAAEYATALERLSEAAMKDGAYGEAVSFSRRLAAADPLSSRAATLLMEALVAAGDPAGALRHGQTHIALLHQELGAQPSAQLIETVRRLRSTNRATAPDAAVETRSEVPPQSRAAVAPVDGRVPLASATVKARTRSLRLQFGAPMGVLAALVIGIAWRGHASASSVAMPLAAVQREATPSRKFRPASIVVAPFANMTRDSAMNVVGAIAAQAITDGLSRLDSIVVMAPTAAIIDSAGRLRQSGKSDGARNLGRESHAQSVVWGAFYRDGDSLRIQAQVIDVADGHVQLTLDPVRTSIARPIAGIESVRDHLMSAIDATRIGWRLGPIGRPPTIAAYREFLRGLKQKWDKGDEVAALTFFENASRLDSTFTLAASYVVLMHQNLAASGFTHRDARIAHFKSADSVARLLVARQAGMSPMEHELVDEAVANANSDMEGALLAARALLRRDSSYRFAHNLVYAAYKTNRPREALSVIRQFESDGRVNENSTEMLHFECRAYHMLGDQRGELKAALKWRAKLPHAEFLVTYELGALAALGRDGEVRRLTDSLMAGWDGGGTPGIFEMLALEFRAHGHEEEARRYIDEGLAFFAKRPAEEATRPGRPNAIARLLMLKGNLDSARTLFERFAAADTAYDNGPRIQLAIIAARLGDTLTARRALNFLDSAAANPFDHGRTRLFEARILASLGRKEAAVQMLYQAIWDGLPFDWPVQVPWHLDPAFASLRDYPPFQAILQPKG